jgi:hypothetical protein
MRALIGIYSFVGGCALFDSADVQGSRSELDLIPAQVHEFGSTQAVAISHEDYATPARTGV